MALEVKVPTVGESINEVTLSKWLVKDGDYVEMDQVLCELESDKATFELPAEKAGVIKIKAKEGADLEVGATIAMIDTAAKAPEGGRVEKAPEINEKQAAEAVNKKSPSEKSTPSKETSAPVETKASEQKSYAYGHASPAAAKLIEENGLDTEKINGSGKDGRITKEDVESAIKNKSAKAEAPALKPSSSSVIVKGNFSREERKEPMSRLRRTIAERLVSAKNDTAMLTTFNEVNMEPVMKIREKYKEKFKQKHGVGLGFMSFFTKAVCNALMEFPAVNGRIEESDIVYHDYCDISIAVSTPRGLVVPVIRNAESLSMNEIEAAVMDLATRGRDNKLALEEMTGGTFTITNGGVFGSLMSTPIINQPQSAILGMHKIEERPVAENGQVVIKPMMYLALSYDHRIIDGKESVSFLVRVKEYLEDPSSLLIGRDPVKALLDLSTSRLKYGTCFGIFILIIAVLLLRFPKILSYC